MLPVAMRFSPLALLILLAAAASPALAWDPYGHMIVCETAYGRLDPKAKAAVDKLAARIPYPGLTYDPTTMGTWMDDLRAKQPEHPYAGKFSAWHYITWGLKPEDASPPLEPGDDNDTKTGNVIQGLQRSYAVLKGGKDPYIPDQAIALAIFSHLAGDVHQPTHCASHFYTDKEGKITNDRGANGVLIDNAPEVALPLGNKAKPNLHAFWDESYRNVFDPATGQLLIDEKLKDYTVKDKAALKTLLATLEGSAPDASVSLAPDFKTWGRESNAIAASYVYEKLPRYKLNRYCDVDAAYVEGAKEIAKKRLVLAAWRLAAALNETLGEGAKP
jgi:hypothetical protein